MPPVVYVRQTPARACALSRECRDRNACVHTAGTRAVQLYSCTGFWLFDPHRHLSTSTAVCPPVLGVCDVRVGALPSYQYSCSQIVDRTRSTQQPGWAAASECFEEAISSARKSVFYTTQTRFELQLDFELGVHERPRPPRHEPPPRPRPLPSTIGLRPVTFSPSKAAKWLLVLST